MIPEDVKIICEGRETVRVIIAYSQAPADIDIIRLQTSVSKP